MGCRRVVVIGVRRRTLRGPAHHCAINTWIVRYRSQFPLRHAGQHSPLSSLAPPTIARLGFVLADKKAYPLRISADILEATQRWAEDELRSLNAQIEYALRDALRRAGRLRAQSKSAEQEAAKDSGPGED